MNGVVQLTGDTLTVGWVAPDFDPVVAAIAHCERGQVRDGVQLLSVARSRQPDSPDLLLNLGIGLNELGEGERAVTILEHLLDLEPDHVRALVALGVALGRLGEDDAALVRFTRVAPSSPQPTRGPSPTSAGCCCGSDAWPKPAPISRLPWNSPPNMGDGFSSGKVVWNPVMSCGADGLGTRPGPGSPRCHSRPGRGAAQPSGHRPVPAQSGIESTPSPRRHDLGVETPAILSPADARNLTLKAALLGEHRLRLTDSAMTHQLEGIPEPLTALQVACLIHAGLQLAAPGTASGFPLKREHQMATASCG